MDTNKGGFLFIDKPPGWTSHDVVDFLRKKTGIQKIGHAGTLDPFATGLLIVGVGRDATKQLDEFHKLSKTYVATLRLGATSDTYDGTGRIMNYESGITNIIDEKKVLKILKTFIGKQKQIPPMYSAKKIGGQKLYELARKGIEVERKSQDIEIYDLQLLEYLEDSLRISCSVSSGTYIRVLAHDIGQVLGVGGYCEMLRRTMIGTHSVEHAVLPEILTIKNWHEYVSMV